MSEKQSHPRQADGYFTAPIPEQQDEFDQNHTYGQNNSTTPTPGHNGPPVTLHQLRNISANSNTNELDPNSLPPSGYNSRPLSVAGRSVRSARSGAYSFRDRKSVV